MTAKKRRLVIALQFLGKLSPDLRTGLKNNISKNLPFCKIWVKFKSSTCISNFFQLKDKMPYCLCSNVVYQFSCGRCNVTYHGERFRHLSVRVGAHSGVSPLSENNSKSWTSKVNLQPDLKILAQISVLRPNKVFWYHVMNPSWRKMKRNYLFIYQIDPSRVKLHFSDIYYYYL